MNKYTGQKIAAIALYCFSHLFLLRFFINKINPDEIFYIAIAKKYSSGNLANALNAYWSPLLSWLLVPLLKLGLQPLFAFRILLFFSGLLALAGILILAKNFLHSAYLKALLLFSATPVICYFSLNFATPNLLLAALLLAYCAFLFTPQYFYKNTNALLCGGLGALSYFAHAYGFIFFLSHFTVINAFYFGQAQEKDKAKILKRFVSGIFIFFILSGAWIFALSAKYATPTVSKSLKVNTVVNLTVLCHPDKISVLRKGLLPPAKENMVNAWEDPSLVPLTGEKETLNLSCRLKILKQNVIHTAAIFLKFSLISWLTLIFLLFYLFKRKRDYLLVFYLLATLLVFCFWLQFVIVEERYLIFAVLLILLGAFKALEILAEKITPVSAKRLLLTLAALSFLIYPISGIKTGMNKKNIRAQLVTPLKTLGMEGNIVSNGEWTETLFFAESLGLNFYGTVKEIPEDELPAELNNKKIAYFWLWQPDKFENYRILSNREEITGGKFKGLKIFKL